MNTPPRPPRGLQKSGRAFWRSITTSLELDRQEQQLLLEACRCADRCDAFDDDIRRRGVVLTDGHPNPSVSEVRQQQVTLARLISTLRLPEDLTRPELRPQRRGAARGVYLVRRNEAS